MTDLIIQLPPGVPARHNVTGAAKILGVQEHDIPVLAAARLLKPLGNPTPSAPKYYATVELLRVAHDVSWLDRATRALSQHWARKNARRPERRREDCNQSPRRFVPTVSQPPIT